MKKKSYGRRPSWTSTGNSDGAKAMNPESIFSNHKGEQSLDELLTVEEVAALLKVPKSWIYGKTRQRGSARLPYVKLGKYLRFEEQAVRAFLQRCKSR